MNLGLCLCVVSGCALLLEAQTTQGIVSGRVFDRGSSAGISGASVTCSNLETSESHTVRSGNKGTYAIPFLIPGRYRIQAEAQDYQPQVLQSMDLQVAGRVELNFPLRSLADLKRGGIYGGVSLAGQREVVNFFGPDVGFAAPLEVLEPQSGTLQPSLSYVIESDEINGLPLRSRDVYSLLLAVPGATSDTATALSLGLSINGQRPTSSNFLLDGVENNDTLNTGTRVQVTPEMVESYRISTNNFSAEFGRTSGFVANAVTKSGSNAFHATFYGYLGNNVFNANSFQDNLQAIPKRPDRELYTGFWAGGPIVRSRLWFASGFEKFGQRGESDPQLFVVPGGAASLFLLPNSAASTLLHSFPSPGTGVNLVTTDLTLSPSVAVDQLIGLERLDYRSASGANRLAERVALSRQSQPDFFFSPYPAFTSGLNVDSTGVVVEYLRTLNAATTNDLRVGWNSALQQLNRAHPEVPTLISEDGVALPSSPLLRSSTDRASTWELADSVVWIRGRHIVTVGGGGEWNRTESANSFGQSGYFVFPSLIDFFIDSPILIGLAAQRDMLPQLVLPDLDRSYTNHQFFGFIQDNLKVSSRIGLSLGLRYDSFGTLRNTGIQDATFVPGAASSIQGEIESGTITYPSGSQNSVYQPDRKNWSGRLGISYDLLGRGTTILRAGAGIYYDRPFGLLVQGIEFNDVSFRFSNLPPGKINFLQPFGSSFPGFLGGSGPGGAPPPSFSAGVPDFYWIDQGLRTPHVQTWFGGVQQQLHKNLTMEVSHTGAFGRKLIASDLVNRQFSIPPSPGNTSGYLNPALPPLIVYRSNQGSSDYLALTSSARYHTARALAQISYTYSHSIDNQSDPLAGQFTGLTAASSSTLGKAAFTSQFDSNGDRANSDFDQRHNFVFYSLYRLPAPGMNRVLQHLFRDWEVSQLGAFRSGFPFTVIAPITAGSSVINQRADLLGGNGRAAPVTAISGGEQFLNPAEFGAPSQFSQNALGNLGRNSIAGPGFFSIDAAISRSFPVPKLGEGGRILIRADLFNVLNHTNLGNPNPVLTSPTFGQSLYGRAGRPSSSLLVAPLDETPRQIRFYLKLQF